MFDTLLYIFHCTWRLFRSQCPRGEQET